MTMPCKFSRFSWLLAVVLACGALNAWAESSGVNEYVVTADEEALQSLLVQDASMYFVEQEGMKLVVTVGKIRNTGMDKVADFKVEVQYFNAQKQLVDVGERSFFNQSIAPGGELAFRTETRMGHPQSAYASQQARVIPDSILRRYSSMNAPAASPAPAPDESQPHSVFTDMLMNWFPLLLLVAVWFYLYRRQCIGPKSTIGRQIALIEAQNKILERIANALEERNKTP